LKREIPATSGLKIWRTPEGKIDYDPDEVAEKFDTNLLPSIWREIYRKSQAGDYEDISDFRRDIEGICYAGGREIAVRCQEKCVYLVELEERLEKVFKMLSGEKL
jgi:hypothetical protein